MFSQIFRQPDHDCHKKNANPALRECFIGACAHAELTVCFATGCAEPS